MNETLEQQIKRLEFCRDCIDQSYKAGRDEYNRLERMIEELKEQLKSIEEVELVKRYKSPSLSLATYIISRF